MCRIQLMNAGLKIEDVAQRIREDTEIKKERKEWGLRDQNFVNVLHEVLHKGTGLVQTLLALNKHNTDKMIGTYMQSGVDDIWWKTQILQVKQIWV